MESRLFDLLLTMLVGIFALMFGESRRAAPSSSEVASRPGSGLVDLLLSPFITLSAGRRVLNGTDDGQLDLQRRPG